MKNAAMTAIPASLRALVSNLIDYAGLYPPAALPLDGVLQRYDGYRASPHAWILNRLVLPLGKLPAVLDPAWRIALLVESEPGPLAPPVETCETKLPRRLSLPTYCEVAIDEVDGAFAKVRTGGLTPDAIPSPETLADFLLRAAARRMPFKATAGLHHPVRSERPLTYAAGSPRAVMHGFLNVFGAAVFAWHGAEREFLLALLREENSRAFEFRGDELRCHGRRLTAAQIAAARLEFAHSFGSCSFEEPLADLRALGLLE